MFWGHWELMGDKRIIVIVKKLFMKDHFKEFPDEDLPENLRTKECMAVMVQSPSFYLSCYSPNLYTCMETIGYEEDANLDPKTNQSDLLTIIYEIETLKRRVDLIYIRHKLLLNSNTEDFGYKHQYSFPHCCNQENLSYWIETVKAFYIDILCSEEKFCFFHNRGITLDDIQETVELLLELEDIICL